jgi:hypothetical protein
LLVCLASVGLICGLLSLVLWVPGIFAVLLGILSLDMAGHDLAQMESGQMDPSGGSQTERAKRYGNGATCLGILGLTVCPPFLWGVLWTCLRPPLAR